MDGLEKKVFTSGRKMIYKIRYPRWFFGDEGDLCKKIIRWGFVVLIVFSPLPAASVDYWAILIIRTIVLVMLSAYLMIREKPDINPRLAAFIRKLRLPLAALFVYIVLQSLPLPEFLIKLLSPMTVQFKQAYSTEPISGSFSTLSLVPLQTFRAAIEFLTYVLAGFLLLKTVTAKEHLRKLICLLIAMGVFQSLYGMIQLARNTPRISIYSGAIDANVMTGTFGDSNQLAGYLFMVIPLCMGMIAARINPYILSKKSWPEKFVYVVNRGGGSFVLLMTSMAVMCSAILLSCIRTGPFLVGFALMLFLFFSLLYFGPIGKNSSNLWKYVRICMAMVLVAVLFFGVEASVSQFAQGKPSGAGGSRVWGGIIRIVDDFPFFGTGLGTYFIVNPFYSTGMNHLSHQSGPSDFLEYLSELGVVGTAVLMYVVIFLGYRLVSVWRERRDPELKGLGMGGIASLVLTVIYGFVNAGVRVPSNILHIFIISSLTLAAVHLNWAGSSESVESGHFRLNEKKSRFRRYIERHEKDSGPV